MCSTESTIFKVVNFIVESFQNDGIMVTITLFILIIFSCYYINNIRDFDEKHGDNPPNSKLHMD